MTLEQVKEKIDEYFEQHNANSDIEMFEVLISDATINDEMTAEKQIECVNAYIDSYFNSYLRFNLLNDKNKKVFKSFMIIKSLDLSKYIEEARNLVLKAKEEDSGYSILVGKQKFESKRFENEDFTFVNEIITNIINTEMNLKDNRFQFMKKSEKDSDEFHLVLISYNKKKDNNKSFLFKK